MGPPKRFRTGKTSFEPTKARFQGRQKGFRTGKKGFELTKARFRAAKKRVSNLQRQGSGPPKKVPGPPKKVFELGNSEQSSRFQREIKKKRNFQKSFRKKFKKIGDFFELFGPKIIDFGADLKKVFDP